MSDSAERHHTNDIGDRFAKGVALRRELLGDMITDQVVAATDDFDRPFQDYVMRNVFGGTWLDARLSKRELALVSVGMLAGAGRFEEASAYFGVALRLGVEVSELQDLLMHITVYCGTPVGRQLFRATKQVLAAFVEEEGGEQSV